MMMQFLSQIGSFLFESRKMMQCPLSHFTPLPLFGMEMTPLPLIIPLITVEHCTPCAMCAWFGECLLSCLNIKQQSL